MKNINDKLTIFKTESNLATGMNDVPLENNEFTTRVAPTMYPKAIHIRNIYSGHSGPLNSIASGKDQNGCTDTYDETARNIVNASGTVIGTVNDHDNVVWKC